MNPHQQHRQLKAEYFTIIEVNLKKKAKKHVKKIEEKTKSIF